MNADRAAELLQIPERGLDLLQRYEEDEGIRKAIQAVQAGFSASDVARMYNLQFDEEAEDEETVSEGNVHVYECQSKRCRQKGRVATASVLPDDENFVEDLIKCSGCRQPMVYVRSVEHEDDIGNLRRARSPRAKMDDPLGRTDKGQGRDTGDEDD